MSIKTLVVFVAIFYTGLLALSPGRAELIPPSTSIPIQYVALPSSTTSTTSTTPPATSTTSPQVTTTFAPIVFPDTPCQEWAPTAVEAGWPADPFVLHKLLTIAHRESRCQPDVTSRDDDRGLLQIHPNSWCRPNRWNPIGWLQAQGILDDCSELYDPLTNLRAARALFLYSEARGDGWTPWNLTR